MLSDKMVESLNRQINRELYSAYFYLGMSFYALEKGLPGVANWFTIQTKEEMTHAQKLFDYVGQQGRRVLLGDIESPPQEFSSIKDLFKHTLEHEMLVTSMIHDLVTLAEKENDRATNIFLQWFITEQVEEEANANEILQKLDLVGNGGNGLFMIDTELGKRVFTPPAEQV